MRILVRALPLLLAAFVCATAIAETGTRTLVNRLAKHADFRVRVRAALELGKTEDHSVRPPLEKALRDRNPAVRAAAAAALNVLGDPRAIPALRRLARDESSSVRAQAKASATALEKLKDQPKPKVLVQLGDVSANQTVKREKGSRRLLGQFKRSSSKSLRRLPGVRVLPDSVDPQRAARGQSVPVVMVTGRVHRAELSREGDSLVCSAKVEFVIHKMPGGAIASLFSGSARGKTSARVARDRKKVAELRRDVVEAAVASAMRRAPHAILAAAK
jgi:hypothetical protein